MSSVPIVAAFDTLHLLICGELSFSTSKWGLLIGTQLLGVYGRVSTYVKT